MFSSLLSKEERRQSIGDPRQSGAVSARNVPISCSGRHPSLICRLKPAASENNKPRSIPLHEIHPSRHTSMALLLGVRVEPPKDYLLSLRRTMIVTFIVGGIYAKT